MSTESTRRRRGDPGPLGLISDAFAQITELLRGELDLARTEVQENLKRAVIAVGLLVAAVVLFLVALNVFAASLVTGIAELGLGAGWAALIVGGVFLVLGAGMIMKGKNTLTTARLAPTRTVKNVQRDVHLTEEATHG